MATLHSNCKTPNLHNAHHQPASRGPSATKTTLYQVVQNSLAVMVPPASSMAF
jgi:hypothetical protein